MNSFEKTQAQIKAVRERTNQILKEVQAQQARFKALFSKYNIDPQIYDRVLADSSISEEIKQRLRDELAKKLAEEQPAAQSSKPTSLVTRRSTDPKHFI